MATSVFRNKNLVRPKKTGTAKRQRIKVQRARLIGLGVAEAVVDKMDPTAIRKMLRYPKKIVLS